MPVHVVFSDVQAHAGHRRQRVAPVQLEAGEFNREDVVFHGVAQGVQDGGPDIADRDGLEPGGLQHRRRQANRGGLAVGAGNGQPVSGLAALRIAEAPGELDVAPDRDVRARRGGQQAPGPDASPGTSRRVRASALDLRDGLDGVLAQQHVHRADDLQRCQPGPCALALVAASTTTTRAPSSMRVSAAAKPDTPMPVTATRSPAQSESQVIQPF